MSSAAAATTPTLRRYTYWNALTAYYEGLFAWDQGNFRAYQPWSGFWQLCGRTWVIAHVTQNGVARDRFQVAAP